MLCNVRLRQFIKNSNFRFRTDSFKLQRNLIILNGLVILSHFFVYAPGFYARLRTEFCIRAKVHKNLQRLVAHRTFFHCICKIEQRLLVFRIFIKHFFQMHKAFAVFLSLKQRKAKRLVYFAGIRADRRGALKAQNRFFKILFLKHNLSNVKINLVILRIKPQNL